MWCRTCQQDVPAVAAPQEPQRVVCSRCGEQLTEENETGAEFSAELPHGAETDPWEGEPLLNESWESNLDAVDRLLGELEVQTTEPLPVRPPVSPSILPPPFSYPASGPPHRVTPRVRNSWPSWLVLSLGLMLMTCSGVLLGWSQVGNRPELWNLAWPLALLGLAGLFIGTALQLEALWQAHREVTETLQQLDQELEQLRQTAARLAATHSQPAQAFYLHYAQQASPQLLLADLKAQLDMLAMSMSGRRAA